MRLITGHSLATLFVTEPIFFVRYAHYKKNTLIYKILYTSIMRVIFKRYPRGIPEKINEGTKNIEPIAEYGAASVNRTRDLIITNDAHYHCAMAAF